uniref:Gfo/Idh/MocA-like oxidoreductase N-terminal domain-containing protein n=1 Tax=Callorhinchus milii TaxID=7868 RepID=A0A4W3HIK9_CALMI
MWMADYRLVARTTLLTNAACVTVMADWMEEAARERFADAMIITTPDRLHKELAVAFAGKGYHVLLEKPMAVSQPLNVRHSVAHVCLSSLWGGGGGGEKGGGVGYYHFAHLFVQGNWTREEESTWMGGKEVISSFVSLSHFTRENKVSICSDTIQCYRGCTNGRFVYPFAAQGKTGWPVSVICEGTSIDVELVTAALHTGPYGRCIYECDNDFITNQVVNMEFEGVVTSSFRMMAFTEMCARKTRIYRTKDEVTVFDFLTQTQHTLDHSALQNTRLRDPGPEETLANHLLVFDAERSRRGTCHYCGQEAAPGAQM